MKITAITRYKHGEIYKAMGKLGWTQTELANRCGFSLYTVQRVVNLRQRPTERVANAIQFVFAEAGIYLDPLSEWPESFSGLKQGSFEQTENITPLSLESPEVRYLEASPVDEMQDRMVELLYDALKDLTEFDKMLIQRNYIDGENCESIAKGLKMGRGGVNARVNKAINRLRHALYVRGYRKGTGKGLPDESESLEILKNIKKEKDEFEAEYYRDNSNQPGTAPYSPLIDRILRNKGIL